MSWNCVAGESFEKWKNGRRKLASVVAAHSGQGYKKFVQKVVEDRTSGPADTSPACGFIQSLSEKWICNWMCRKRKLWKICVKWKKRRTRLSIIVQEGSEKLDLMSAQYGSGLCPKTGSFTQMNQGPRIWQNFSNLREIKIEEEGSFFVTKVVNN